MKKRMELESDKEDFSLIIPDELMIHIFSYLSAKELGQISLVNRFWNALANDNSLWTHLSKRDGYGTPSENILNQSYDGKQHYYEMTRKIDVHLFFSLSLEINMKFFHHGKIEDFKDEICKQRNIQRKPDSSFPKLKFDDKFLENQDTLASSNIQPGASIVVILEGTSSADIKRRKKVDPVTGKPSTAENAISYGSYQNRSKVDPSTGKPSNAENAISRNLFRNRSKVDPSTGKPSNAEDAISYSSYQNKRKVDPVTGDPSNAENAISNATFRSRRKVDPVRGNPATGEDVNPNGKKHKHSEEKLVLSQDKSRPIKRHKNEPPLWTPALFSLSFTFPPSDEEDDELVQNEESNQDVYP